MVEPKDDRAQHPNRRELVAILDEVEHVFAHGEAKANQGAVHDAVEHAIELAAKEKEEADERERFDRLLDERRDYGRIERWIVIADDRAEAKLAQYGEDQGGNSAPDEARGKQTQRLLLV